MKNTTRIMPLLVVVLLICTTSIVSAKSDLMLAKIWRKQHIVSEYLVSEKLDGIRARWDGKNLISRGGHKFAAPEWFVVDFPYNSIDGELWIERGSYQLVSSVVSKKKPHEGWQKVKFMIFDLPMGKEVFAERVAKMKQLVSLSKSPYLKMINQYSLGSNHQLMKLLDEIIADGGEGLMLHHKDAHYKKGRSDNLLKLKKFTDDDAIVIGYKQGKGKYKGMVGSLKVRMKNRKEFYLGSGLNDKNRIAPPPLGSIVTYKHQGYTDRGIPRFAVFMRVRIVE